jgi:hypothetical protein
MPPHASANAANVAQAIEMLSPPAAATFTVSAIVETLVLRRLADAGPMFGCTLRRLTLGR